MGERNAVILRFCWTCKQGLYTTAKGIKLHAAGCTEDEETAILARLRREEVTA